ncbi:hypothetical protein DT075_00905 [Bacillus licheniformis]|nr:hypothetical protein DT075_00905 [Bacillus licheniformis]
MLSFIVLFGLSFIIVCFIFFTILYFAVNLQKREPKPSVYKNQGKGYQSYQWNGKINDAASLKSGKYYMLAYASAKGKSSYVLTEDPFIVE